MNTRIVALDEAALYARLEALSRIVADSVHAGAAIGFLAPMSHEDAAHFWTATVSPELTSGRRVLLIAELGDEVVGTVQLLTAMPPNQPHRCEIAKMVVHPAYRRKGIGRSLMNSAIEHAASLGKTLITLDTRTNDTAEPLYRSVGFQVAGSIPDFAYDPDGRARHATTYMYRRV